MHQAEKLENIKEINRLTRALDFFKIGPAEPEIAEPEVAEVAEAAETVGAIGLAETGLKDSPAPKKRLKK